MFPQDKELIIAIITTSALILFLVVIIVTAIVKYQRNRRVYFRALNKLKIEFQEETIKALIEKEDQTLTRISQEIHDNIGQILSLVKLNLNTLDLGLCPDSLKGNIAGTKNLVAKVINDLRQLSKSLNSMHLSGSCLSESLGRELEIINKSGVYSSNLVVNGEEKQLEPKKQLIIFRIVQEALNNIIKHAHAKNISVVLGFNEQFLFLTVQDDGVGFDLPKNGSKDIGTGIGNMCHRAKLIGGSIDIRSATSAGTTIELKVPTG